MSHDWPPCSQCGGACIAGRDRCLAHANPGERTAALKQLSESGDLDVRGVIISDSLLKEILDAAPHNTDGYLTFSTVQCDGATLESRAMFVRATFKGAALFGHATFKGDALFSHAGFERFADFSNVIFEDGAAFDRATFKDNASFAQTTFNNVNFSKATFNGAEFGQAIFKGDAEFYSATFKGDAEFGQASFEGNARFSDATFKGRTDFPEAIFKGDNARFSKTRFERFADFNNATFKGSAWFDEATFKDSAWFFRTTFKHATFVLATFKGAEFSQSTFKGNAHFEQATFNGIADATLARFGRATFEGDAGFSKTTCEGVAGFDQTTFKGKAEFNQATFKSEAKFDKAIFKGVAGFEHTTVKKSVRFAEARFEGEQPVLGPIVVEEWFDLDSVQSTSAIRVDAQAGLLTCRRGRFPGGVQFDVRRALVRLDNTDLSVPSLLTGPPVGDPAGSTEQPKLLSLQGANVAGLTLGNVSLVNCRFAGAHNIDKLRLETDTVFGLSPARAMAERRQVIAEECAWRAARLRPGRWVSPAWPDLNPSTGTGPPFTGTGPPELLDPGAIAVLYRALRKVREDAEDEPGAADFYYGALEMGRHDRGETPRDRWQGLATRRLLFAYWLVSGYGLRAWRSLTAFAVLIAVSAIAFHFIGFTRPPEPASYWTSLLFAFRSTISLTDAQVQLTAWGSFLQALLRLTGPLLLGLTLFALRAQVKRAGAMTSL